MEALLDLLSTPSAVGFWQTFAIDALLRATLALAATALVCAALRRASASVRHLVWASALGVVLALPPLMLALPSWRVSIRPRARPAPPISVGDRQALSPPESVALERPARAAAEPLARHTTTPLPAVRSSARPVTGNWTDSIAAAWGVGAFVVMLPLLAGHARLRWLERRSAPWTDRAVLEAIERLGLQRRVVILRGDETISPMTWGTLRPVILLPAGAETWPRERLRAVLLHELAHVTRWDCLSQMLARLACAVYWFHPLVWVAAHRLRVESEQACDNVVLQSGARATEYAVHLLDVARNRHSCPALSAAVVPMARPSQLEGRLRAILDHSRSRRCVTRRGACLMFVAVAAVLVPLSAARLATRVAGATAPEQGEKRSDRMTVSGRVLDPDGRSLPGANVAVIGRRKLAMLSARADDQHEVLGRAQAGANGRFRVEVPRTSSITHYELHAVASGAGFGLGWAELNRDAEAPAADVQLRVEQPIEGQLIDLQGAPAAGVKLRISSFGVEKKEVGGYEGMRSWKNPPKELDGLWPRPEFTDAEGRFRIPGIGRGLLLSLAVDDFPFARQILRIETNAAEGPKRATLALQPAMRVSGRVTCADTGEPLIDAIVRVGSGATRFNTTTADYRTDADGRYEANPASEKYVKVTVYPPVGSPYLIFERNFEGNDGAARREVNLAVPRGVLLTGRVTERGSGRPLTGAGVYYANGRSNGVEGEGTIPGWMSAVASNAEGRYAIAVSPGKGHLLVYGPTADFVHEVKGNREIVSGKPGGNRNYAHAFLPYEVKKGEGPIERDVALKPSVTVAGRVVGPDGQTVDRAEIITTLSISPSHTFWRGDFTIPVRDGRFELHGVAPDRPVICSFLDAKNGWGASLKVTAAMAVEGPLTVKLERSGTAKARLLDEQDRPVAKGTLQLNIVGTEGPGSDHQNDSLTEEEQAVLRADEAYYVNVDRLNYWQGPRSDREGHIAFPRLIPGATYRIYDYQHEKDANVYRWRDFTVEAGRTTDLGDVRVKTEGL